jgi:hypothetical protein
MLPPDGIEDRVKRATILPAPEGRSKGLGEKQSQNTLPKAFFATDSWDEF